jgi:alpha-ketoglutaric semialdehyde dehydrogenase
LRFAVTKSPCTHSNPATGQDIETPVFGSGSVEHVAKACELAAAAFDPYRSLPLAVRAEFLERIADGITRLGDALIQRAHDESGLPKARLEGERGRTTGQLKLFAEVVWGGLWLAATLDSPLPERKPLPRSDLRMQKIAIGPVAVFGASNFPLTFSVAGGDTAAALAAGCPVVVKAHRAHLGTSEMVGRVIQRVAAEMNLPEGVFSMIVGAGNTVGEALVAHPAVKAVGFTGSRAGGTSLMKVAANRPEPIPVYAEMSSINPVFLLPTALAARGENIARGFVDSLVLGAGQFCTNPRSGDRGGRPGVKEIYQGGGPRAERQAGANHAHLRHSRCLSGRRGPACWNRRRRTGWLMAWIPAAQRRRVPPCS